MWWELTDDDGTEWEDESKREEKDLFMDALYLYVIPTENRAWLLSLIYFLSSFSDLENIPHIT